MRVGPYSFPRSDDFVTDSDLDSFEPFDPLQDRHRFGAYVRIASSTKGSELCSQSIVITQVHSLDVQTTINFNTLIASEWNTRRAGKHRKIHA